MKLLQSLKVNCYSCKIVFFQLQQLLQNKITNSCEQRGGAVHYTLVMF